MKNSCPAWLAWAISAGVKLQLTVPLAAVVAVPIGWVPLESA